MQGGQLVYIENNAVTTYCVYLSFIEQSAWQIVKRSSSGPVKTVPNGSKIVIFN